MIFILPINNAILNKTKKYKLYTYKKSGAATMRNFSAIRNSPEIPLGIS